MQPISIKISVLQPPALQKELPQVNFLGIYRTTTPPHNFWTTNCYEVTIIKKCNKPLLQKTKTKIFNLKRSIKICSKSMRKISQTF